MGGAPNYSGYTPDFTLTGGNLPVPVKPAGLPAVDPTTGLPLDPAAGTYPAPAVIPQAGASVGGEAGAGINPAAAALGSAPEAEAGSPGLLATLANAAKSALPFLKGAAVPALAASAALANDPGNLSERNHDGTLDPAAHYFNQGPEDTGLTNTLKGAARGAIHAGSTIDDYFTKTNAEKDAENAGKKGPDEPAQSHYSMEQALGLAPISGASNASSALGGKFTIGEPSQGKSLAQQIIELTAPSAGNGAMIQASPEMQKKYELQGMAKGLLEATSPDQRMSKLSPIAHALLGAGLGGEEGGTAYQQAVLGRQLELKEKQADWGVKAAEVGTKGEEEQHKESMDQVKIHATRYGTWIEGEGTGPDGKPQRVIQPMANANFQAMAAGALDPKGQYNAMGGKFNGAQLNANPLGKQVALLSQLESTGQINSFLQDPAISKLMQRSDAVATKMYGAMGQAKLSSEIQNSRRAVLIKAMNDNPKLQQDMIDRVASLRQRTHMGNASSALGGDLYDTQAPPTSDEDDGLTNMLDKAQEQE